MVGNSRLSQQMAELTQFIRDPEHFTGPSGIEPRRLTIYRELFYNNIEGFISSGFPVLKSLYLEGAWQKLIREFMKHHYCETPYFLEISQEFLNFIEHRALTEVDPPFMLELAHYEWVELALDTSETDLTAMPYDINGDLLEGLPIVSPVAWPLAYQFPVHKISHNFQPQEPSEQPTFLIVYRNRALDVKFMESNAVTVRLLELLGEDNVTSGKIALEQLAKEMGHADITALNESGSQILQQLTEADILLGV